jgi:hypothetical protein
VAAAASGSAATNTPFSAPTQVPTTRSGRTPASASAQRLPTSRSALRVRGIQLDPQ